VLKVSRPGFLRASSAELQTTVGAGVTTAPGLPEGDAEADPVAAADAVALGVAAGLAVAVGVPVAAVVGVAAGGEVGATVGDAAGVHAMSVRLATASVVRTRRKDIYGSS
jgi:hypothetical protein